MIRRALAATVVAVAAIGTAPVANADPMSDLIGMLPSGYAPDSCRGAKQVPRSALVALACDEVTGIVPPGKYELFPSLAALNHQFDVDFHGTVFKPIKCPGAPGIGPGSITGGSGWAGRLACGWVGDANNPTFDVMWTNEPRLLWARVHGPNLIGLMDWFNSEVGPS